MADRPPYQPWYEGDFWTLRVRTMHPMARLMYRSILLAAWDLSEPGKIPNDMNLIQKMADCPHPNIWKKHGPSVMAMFELSGDGRHYTNTRQQQELEVAARLRAVRVENGKKGGRPSGKVKALKTKGNGKATALSSFPLANVQQSTHPIPSHPNPSIQKLLSTSHEVAQLLSKYSEQEQCAVAEIWPYYLERCERDPKRYELTPQRITKAVMRFRECRKKTGTYEGALALMREAIDNLAANDWNMGRDPKTEGKRWVDFVDHLFGSYSEMEKRLNDRSEPRKPIPIPKGRDAMKEFEEQLGIGKPQ